ARKARSSVDEVRARLAQYGFRAVEPALRLPRLRPGGAWHLLLEVATDDPGALPAYVSGLREDGALTARRLRDAVLTSLLTTKQPNADAGAALRRLADSYDPMSERVAESDAVRALLFDGAAYRELTWFVAGIDRLADIEWYEPSEHDDDGDHGTPDDVAT